MRSAGARSVPRPVGLEGYPCAPLSPANDVTRSNASVTTTTRRIVADRERSMPTSHFGRGTWRNLMMRYDPGKSPCQAHHPRHTDLSGSGQHTTRLSLSQGRPEPVLIGVTTGLGPQLCPAGGQVARIG
jgi:hypothetical protein